VANEEALMMYLQIAGGLVLLLGGGEFLVRGAVAVAARLGLSPMFIGLTLVGFGTSTPELVASINAALAGAPGITLGNVIGSNIANILLILAVSAAITPMQIHREAFRRDGPVLTATTALALGACMFGVIGRTTGAVFFLMLLAYLAISYIKDRRAQDAAAALHAAEAQEMMPPHPRLPRSMAMAIGGIAGVLLGADLLVDGAITVAEAAGLSQTLIGLTLVAIGTSLPELATSIIAAIRRHSDVAFGNVIGSNIFNLLGVMGITAVVRPIDVPRQIVVFDGWVMAGATALLLIFAATGSRLNRWEAALFLTAYVVYIAVQFSPGFQDWVK
jgi:cation:H+ antiporter